MFRSSFLNAKNDNAKKHVLGLSVVLEVLKCGALKEDLALT